MISTTARGSRRIALRIDGQGHWHDGEGQIRIYGDVALLSGRTRMKGTHLGKPFTSHYRYIDVYVRQGDTWKVVSVQISKIPS